MQIRHHILEGAEQIPSPNCDERSSEESLDLIVIHCISLPRGHFGGSFVSDLFCNRLNTTDHGDFHDLVDLHVSAHLLIRRRGEIIQFVPFNKRAWHAGVSSYEGVPNCNDYAIGIELEGTDDTAYTPAQYDQTATVCRALATHYSLDLERIAGHAEIAPDRKTDPGKYFDWDHFRMCLGKKRS